MTELPSTILVTGGLGWLGRSLLQALTRGLGDVDFLRDPVPGLRLRVLLQPGQDPAELAAVAPRAEAVMGDLRSPEDGARFCRDAEGAVLISTAGVIHPRRVREFYDVNVRGNGQLLQAAADAGIRRAVVVSSNSPCGCNPHADHRFDEESPYAPYLHYGRSKMLLEQEARRQGEAGRIETVIVRAPWFYGPFQPPRQTLFFRLIRDGRMPIVGDGENRRSMAYVDNLAQGLLLAASVPAARGRTYWIADERPYTMNEIVDCVERLLRDEFRVPCKGGRRRLPGAVAGIAERIDRMVQACGFYFQKIHVLSEMNKSIACSVARAKEELGYRPAVDLEEGMRRSLRWVIGQGLLP